MYLYEEKKEEHICIIVYEYHSNKYREKKTGFKL